MAYGIVRGVYRPDIHGEKHNQLKYSNMVGVTRDATSAVYAPATAAEWATTMAAAGIASGGPSFLWLMQAAASPIPEVISGVVSLPTVNTAGSFAQPVAGWSRLGWTAADASNSVLFSTSASLPEASTTSVLMLMYTAVLATPAATRTVGLIAGATVLWAPKVTTANVAQVVAIPGNTGTGTSNLGTGVRPWVGRHNFSASTQTLFTDQDKIVPTFTALSGHDVGVGGGASGTNPSIWCGYACMFRGAAAELTDAQVRTLLQTLGWAIAWT